MLYLLAVMLLMVRFTLAENTRHWRAIGLRFSPDLGWDFMQAGVFFAVIVVLLPNLLPLGPASALLESDLNAANNPWQQAQARLQSIFSGAGGKGSGGAGFFSNDLQLVGDFTPSNVQVLHYQLAPQTQGDPRQYLITQAYDTYDGQDRWTNATMSQHSYDANLSLPQSSRGQYHYDTYNITFDAVPSGGERSLFAPGGEAANFNIPTTVVFSVINGAESSPIAWLDRTPLDTHSSYQATGYVSSATVAQLSQVPYPTQAAATTATANDYPENVMVEYLPTDTGYISPPVQQTAAQVTQGAPTMYQAAVDIETYLHTFAYSTHNPSPPSNQDAVAWFLHRKIGFCTYFASAMVLMARSLGMPARIVSGYTNGKFDPTTNSYNVTGAQAHTWTQIYFGQYGWINFEPTAQFSQFIRPLPITAQTTPTVSATKTGARGSASRTPIGVHANSQGQTTGTKTGQSSAFVGVGLGLGALLLLLALVVAFLVFWWRALYRALSPVAAAFARITLLGGWAGAPPSRSQTPSEYVERLGALAPTQRGSFRRLSDLYARERWGGGLDQEASAEATSLYTHTRRSLTEVIARRVRRAPLAALGGLRSLRLRGRRVSLPDDDDTVN